MRHKKREVNRVLHHRGPWGVFKILFYFIRTAVFSQPVVFQGGVFRVPGFQRIGTLARVALDE